jgi:hypothetical protein
MKVRLHSKAIAGLLACSALALSACGDDKSDSGGQGKASGNASTKPAPSPGTTPEAPTQINGGETVLKLDRNVMRIFDLAGVQVEPSGAAMRKNGAITLPIVTGDLDIDTLSGRLQHEGGLRFSAAGHDLVASNLVIWPKRGRLTADVDQRRVELFDLGFGRPRVPPTGDEIVLPANVSIHGGALADRLGADALRGGLRIGRLTVTAQGADRAAPCLRAPQAGARGQGRRPCSRPRRRAGAPDQQGALEPRRPEREGEQCGSGHRPWPEGQDGADAGPVRGHTRGDRGR